MTPTLLKDLLKENLRIILALVSEGNKSRFTPGRIILKSRNKDNQTLKLDKNTFKKKRESSYVEQA